METYRKEDIRRGDIYYADLSPVVGSEQGGIRPVVILQNNVGNRHSPTVIAAAITSRKGTPQIPEPEITAAVLRLYHKLKLGQETVLRPVLSQLQELRERELRSNRKISDIDNEIARISEQNLVLVRLKSKGYVDSALYLSQMDEIDRKLRELRKLRRRLLEAAGEDRQIHDTERMMEYLEDGPEWLDEVPAELFGELIERIIIISPERLKFRLLNGMELAENIERTVR